MNVASRSVVEAKDSFITSRLPPVAAASTSRRRVSSSASLPRSVARSSSRSKWVKTWSGRNSRALLAGRWYRAVYSDNGAMPGSSLAELALEAGRRVVPLALEIVKSDIRSVPSQGLRLALEEGPASYFGSANGIFLLGNRLISTTTEDAIIEIAEIIQDEVIGVLMQFWPSCPSIMRRPMLCLRQKFQYGGAELGIMRYGRSRKVEGRENWVRHIACEGRFAAARRQSARSS
jgi:hypothetical protein